MAPGYVIALIVEAAGAFGVLLAFFVMRAERRARSYELRGYLRSGSSAFGHPSGRPTPRPRGSAVRIVDLPAASRARGAESAPDAARAALHRVLMPRAATIEVGRSVSAG